MKVREVIDLIKQNAGIVWPDRSFRDTLKTGDPEAEVKGIATTMMATFDMLKRANQAGLNMIITHEDTWWNDRDETKDLLTNPLYLKKADFINKNGLNIWRNHDSTHAMKVDITVTGTLRAIGVKGGENASMRPGILPIPEMTLGEFASQAKRLSGIRHIRVVGDPKQKVSKVLDGPGYATPRFTLDTDVVVGGESQEADGGFDNVEYVADANSLGIHKGLVMLGHVVSEQPGHDDYAKWLQTFIKGVPIQYVAAEEPFWV
ncbi:MAG: Nif3-like dinuclear metal center hexameric protein [Candidatus Solibacter sp.]